MNKFVSGQWNAICTICEQELPLSSFYTHSNGKPRKQCKTCHLARSKKWAESHPDKRLAQATKTREKNYNKCLEATRQWRKRNLQYDAFRAKLYRTRKQQQVPPWADIEKIKNIYLTCPKGYHVDHIIPLKGKLVSGLHVETNLQHLPAKENMKKRNHFHDVLFVGTV